MGSISQAAKSPEKLSFFMLFRYMLGVNVLLRTEYQILILYNFFQTPGLILSGDKTHQSSIALPVLKWTVEQFPPLTTTFSQYFLFVIVTSLLPSYIVHRRFK